MAYPYYPYYQPVQNMQQMQSVQPQSGFISVRNEQEARNYSIAHGNSLVFKDENEPYLYIKTMGFSQMDIPTFEKYRLVREQNSGQNSSENENMINTATSQFEKEIGAINEQIQCIKKDINILMDFKAEFGGENDV